MRCRSLEEHPSVLAGGVEVATEWGLSKLLYPTQATYSRSSWGLSSHCQANVIKMRYNLSSGSCICPEISVQRDVIWWSRELRIMIGKMVRNEAPLKGFSQLMWFADSRNRLLKMCILRGFSRKTLTLNLIAKFQEKEDKENPSSADKWIGNSCCQWIQSFPKFRASRQALCLSLIVFKKMLGKTLKRALTHMT